MYLSPQAKDISVNWDKRILGVPTLHFADKVKALICRKSFNVATAAVVADPTKDWRPSGRRGCYYISCI